MGKKQICLINRLYGGMNLKWIVSSYLFKLYRLAQKLDVNMIANPKYSKIMNQGHKNPETGLKIMTFKKKKSLGFLLAFWFLSF